MPAHLSRADRSARPHCANARPVRLPLVSVGDGDMTMIRILGVAALQALPASPVSAPAPHASSPSDVSVTVEATGTGDSTGYRVLLTNTTAEPVTATVVQHLPSDATEVVARDAKVEDTKVTWAVRVGANSSTALESTATVPVPHDALT